MCDQPFSGLANWCKAKAFISIEHIIQITIKLYLRSIPYISSGHALLRFVLYSAVIIPSLCLCSDLESVPIYREDGGDNFSLKIILLLKGSFTVKDNAP